MLLCPWDFPGKNTGVGCHFFLQGIFPDQGSNPSLLHWQAVFLFFFFTTEPPGKLAPGITELDKQEKTFEPERVRPLLLMVSSE